MEFWKICRALNNEIRLLMLREIVRSPNHELNVVQVGDFVGLKKAAASQYLKQLADAGFLNVERSGRYVVCSSNLRKDAVMARLLNVLSDVLSKSPRSNWQEGVLKKVNAFAHHVRIAILRAVSAAGRCGFAELAKVTGLPPATLRRQVGILIEANVIDAGEDAQGQRAYSLARPGDALLRVLLSLAVS